MLRSIFLAGLGLALLGGPAVAQNAPPPKPAPNIPKIDLWHGAESGMTPEEVAELFPQAESLIGDTLGTGFIERLRITPYEVDGADYAVKFFFDATVLRSVLLSLEPQEETRSEEATAEQCDARAAALKAEFGEPVDTRVNMQGIMPLNRTYTYRSGEKEAVLLCLGHSDHTSIVNMAFQPAMEEETDD